MPAYAGAAPLAATHEQSLEAGERFAAFVARHGRFAFRVAYALTRSTGDAEDAVQEMFMKLYRTGSWEGAENERAYVARAVWRIAGELRARRPVHDDLGEQEFASAAPSPERQALDADAHARVHRLIDALPEKLRQPLVLCSVEGMSSAEVAFTLGVPGGTVRRRVKEARDLLREKLGAAEEVRRGR